jgi:hypothetical protein
MERTDVERAVKLAGLSLPAVTVTKIGEAPPVALPDGGRPLSGVRVLDLTRVLAGPTAPRPWPGTGPTSCT